MVFGMKRELVYASNWSNGCRIISNSFISPHLVHFGTMKHDSMGKRLFTSFVLVHKTHVFVLRLTSSARAAVPLCGPGQSAKRGVGELWRLACSAYGYIRPRAKLHLHKEGNHEHVGKHLL